MNLLDWIEAERYSLAGFAGLVKDHTGRKIAASSVYNYANYKRTAPEWFQIAAKEITRGKVGKRSWQNRPTAT